MKPRQRTAGSYSAYHATVVNTVVGVIGILVTLIGIAIALVGK